MKYRRKLLVSTAFFFFLSASAWASSVERYFAAALRDDDSTVIALTLRGFDLNTRSPQGEHALTVAISQGALKVANFLLDQLAVDVNGRNAAGETPLMMAAIKGELALVRRLIQERKAQVNHPGWTPLHYAASSKSSAALEITQLLLEHHAYIDAESPNRTTPLMMAAMYGTEASADWLLREGADPLLRNQQGLTAIDFAHRAGRTSLAERIAAQARTRQPAGRW